MQAAQALARYSKVWRAPEHPYLPSLGAVRALTTDIATLDPELGGEIHVACQELDVALERLAAHRELTRQYLNLYRRGDSPESNAGVNRAGGDLLEAVVSASYPAVHVADRLSRLGAARTRTGYLPPGARVRRDGERTAWGPWRDEGSSAVPARCRDAGS